MTHVPKQERAWLTPSEAARKWEVTPRTIRRWAEDGLIPAYRTPSGQWRIVKETTAA